MKTTFLYMPVLGILTFATYASGATTWTQSWNLSAAIPDNDDVGFSDTRMVNTPMITEIESVTVNLSFSGGWNGDLYAYLVNETGFAVLLNRPGRSPTDPEGSATVGMNIHFDDAALDDLHVTIPLTGGSINGTYQPSGRNIDPLTVINSDPRTAMLSSFVGLDANGAWTLFVADQSAGDISTLESWTLTITGIPEPSSSLLVLTSGIALTIYRRRKVKPIC